MNQMKDLGLVSKEDYGVITLTEKGLSISKKIYMNHRLISKYLEHSLSLPSGIAEENACKMEHVLNVQMLDAIKGYLKNHNITVIVD
jgi:Mn-dependent DtxR family transcriptional regulator